MLLWEHIGYSVFAYYKEWELTLSIRIVGLRLGQSSRQRRKNRLSFIKMMCDMQMCAACHVIGSSHMLFELCEASHTWYKLYSARAIGKPLLSSRRLCKDIEPAKEVWEESRTGFRSGQKLSSNMQNHIWVSWGDCQVCFPMLSAKQSVSIEHSPALHQVQLCSCEM